MRRELLGIFLFFLVVFTLVSLLSYSPMDPSINNAVAAKRIYNLFGVLGAHTSGFLIGLFGIGAFWMPILLFLTGFRIFFHRRPVSFLSLITGGLLLILTTGSLLALKQNDYALFGVLFSSGGILGIPLKSALVKYANITGSLLILSLLWVTGFILATGFSIIIFSKRVWISVFHSADHMINLVIMWIERRKKAKKRTARIKTRAAENEPDIQIKAVSPKRVKGAPAPRQAVFEFMQTETGYQRPSVNLLDDPDDRPDSVDNENLRMQSKLLEKKLEDFGVSGKVVAVTPGPVITTFEYEPSPGVKINKIVNLTDDLALALRAISIRIVAPIPGKAVIGIEIPNLERETVRFKEVIVAPVFEKAKSKLTIVLGKDIAGNPVAAELNRMPHLLIAGATGSGKSVALNTMICSLLYKANPDEVKLIMIDPKRIELSMYDGIPHLITPVVTDVKKATNALYWAVREMEARYERLSEKKAKHIDQYNQKVEKEQKASTNPDAERLPYIVIIIDELADLMMVASRDVEVALTRLAQMARAAGIHLILATQRPSVDVLTGIIKANFPTRLSFQVSSKTDSRTIIDANGAEHLLGNGDMLFLPPGAGKLQRIHGAYISESELVRITEYLKNQQKPDYLEDVIESQEMEKGAAGENDYDERYDDAVALITQTRQASISMIQRHLRIGYNRAARIIETMEKEGIVGPSDGSKPREVLVRGYDNNEV